VREDLRNTVEGYNSDYTFAAIEARFFITHHRPMGLATANTSPDDLVSILLGDLTPFIAAMKRMETRLDRFVTQLVKHTSMAP
jgi:hypothetical protein